MHAGVHFVVVFLSLILQLETLVSLVIKVIRPSFFGGVPCYFEAL